MVFHSAHPRSQRSIAPVIIFFGLLLTLNGCGIYTVKGALVPPFNQSVTSTELKFAGYNTESYFSGYIIWYKGNVWESFSACYYKDELSIPTIPKIEEMEPGWVAYIDLRSDPDDPRIEYMVNVEDMKPHYSLYNFKQLNELYGSAFYFAASSYGVEGEESEKVEFGSWP